MKNQFLLSETPKTLEGAAQRILAFAWAHWNDPLWKAHQDMEKFLGTYFDLRKEPRE
jgi:hypothetical protein